MYYYFPLLFDLGKVLVKTEGIVGDFDNLFWSRNFIFFCCALLRSSTNKNTKNDWFLARTSWYMNPWYINPWYTNPSSWREKFKQTFWILIISQLRRKSGIYDLFSCLSAQHFNLFKNFIHTYMHAHIHPHVCVWGGVLCKIWVLWVEEIQWWEKNKLEISESKDKLKKNTFF